MKKTLLLLASALLSVSAFAQTFSREMPCKSDLGDIIATKMGTICLPYEAKPVDCSVYKLVSASSDEWIFQEVLQMEANTPYLFVVANNTTLEANFEKVGEEIACDAPVGEAAGVANGFVGSYKREILRGKKLYFISYDKINYNNGQPIISTPNRAYFSADVMPAGQTLSKDVKMTFLPVTTRINAVAESAEEKEVSVARQNIGLQQGRYNINGKKAVVK